MPILHFRVDEETYKKIVEMARAEGITVSEFLRRLVLKELGGDHKPGGISAIEKKLEELEKRVEELEKALRRGRGLGAYLK